LDGDNIVRTGFLPDCFYSKQRNKGDFYFDVRTSDFTDLLITRK